MEVDIWVQVVAMKLVDSLGVSRIDVPEADVLADDGSILGFDQSIVAAMLRS
jgi:hypothetical protein